MSGTLVSAMYEAARGRAASSDAFVRLFLCLLKENSLAQCRVKLHDLNLALGGFLILTRPNNMLGLRRLELEQTVL